MSGIVYAVREAYFSFRVTTGFYRKRSVTTTYLSSCGKLCIMSSGTESKDDHLIAYNTLEKKIIDSNFCTLCGACEAVCPVDAIQIEGDQVKRLHNCANDLICAQYVMKSAHIQKRFFLEV